MIGPILVATIVAYRPYLALGTEFAGFVERTRAAYLPWEVLLPGVTWVITITL